MGETNRFELAMNMRGFLPQPILIGELLAPLVELVPLDEKPAYLNHHHCPPPQQIPPVQHRVRQPNPQHGNRLGKRGQV